MTGLVFPPAATVVRVAVTAALGIADGHHGIVTPDDITSALPFVLVYRYGGRTPDGITDYPELALDVFAADASGEDLAEDARQAAWAAVARPITIPRWGAVVLDEVEELEGPNEAPAYGELARRWTSRWRYAVRAVPRPTT